MGLKKYRPTTPARRHGLGQSLDDVTRVAAHRALLRPLPKTGGRNNQGRITARHRGGGERRHYRVIDFGRDKHGVVGRVVSVQYDPNRSARIALISYADGEYRYVIHPAGLRVGDQVRSGRNLQIWVGNAMPLSDIPVGVEVHNVQLYPNGRSFLVRSAGTSAQVLAKEGSSAVLRLPSGEIRRFDVACFATVGAVSNPEHKDLSLGRAGRVRHRGRRPRVRAVAMNPVDHPMGGGEGRSSGGRHPCSEQGKPAKGARTRNPKKKSGRLIVQRRKT